MSQPANSETVRDSISRKGNKPNFVVIYTDDQGYADLGCYGSADLKTPHLDAIARSGVRFTNWYSSSPVCSPSRASLLTGCYPHRVGIPQILGGARGTQGLSCRHMTLARALKILGYRTGIFGKWHLGVAREFGPNAHGFDEFFGFLAGCVDYYSHLYYYQMAGGVKPVHDLWHNDKEVWHNGEYLTELLTDKAVDFIRRTDEPFFLYVPFNAPHYPMHAPKKYLDRFPDLKPDRRIMAAMVAAVDDGVGRIVNALKEKGVYDDTVIFFSSDNGPSCENRNWLDGTMDPYYGGSAGMFRGHKGCVFEGGIRVPAILSWPKHIPANLECHKVGSMMDVFPTFMELAGVPDQYKVDGSSILAMVLEGADSPHKDLFWEYDGQFAVRHGKWKLVLNSRLSFDPSFREECHLADLEADPAERVNLKDEHPQLVEELKSTVEEWYAITCEK